MLGKLNLLQNRRGLFVFLLIVTAFGIIGGWFWQARLLGGQARDNRDLTHALEVVVTTIVDDHVKISLRNVSSKNINGIEVSVDSSTSQIEFLAADEPSHQVLLPGAIIETWFPLSNTSTPVDVSVLAVVFDDQTGDGDPSLIKEITEQRLGVKKQLMRFRPILKAALSSPDADSIAILDELKSKIEDLPDGLLDKDSADSGAMRIGQSIAKQQIHHDVEALRRTQLNKGGVMIRQALADIQTKHNKRMQALSIVGEVTPDETSGTKPH